MIAKIDIQFDRSKVESEVQKKTFDAQAALDLAVMKDTDQFVPFLTGQLSGSVSNPEKGLIVYNAIYARHMYYGIHYLTKRPFHYNTVYHPHAGERWFESSKSAYLGKWVKQVEEIFRR